MLDCEDGENSNCKHCQALGETPQPTYWDIPLDPDLLQTIANHYPEWFKDMNLATEPESKLSIKEESTQKNKESLKVKLMLRRPHNQLVDQSILPTLKSPAFHEERQKFEKSKMGDILKHKLQKRPDRQDITPPQISENSTSHSNDGLKKSRLLESLNGLPRSGPVDIVRRNNSEELLAQVVRDSGLNLCDTPSPKLRTPLDDDSGSDFSPSPPYEFSEHSQSSLPSLEASEPSPGATSFSMSPSSSVSSPLSVMSSTHQEAATTEYHIHQFHQLKNIPRNNSRKKTKPKPQPKAKTIKFHEYRGPPNAQKPSTTAPVSISESNSELWFQQQQLLHQLQLEQQKYAQTLSQNSAQRPTGDQIIQKPNPPPTPQPVPQLIEAPSSPQKLVSNFEELKVSDLKTKLKDLNLPRSGNKTLLIQRLIKHMTENGSLCPTNSAVTCSPVTISLDSVLLDSLQQPISLEPADTLQGLLSTIAVDAVGQLSDLDLSNEHIVQLQQLMIEKLQDDINKNREKLREYQVPVCTSISAEVDSNAVLQQATSPSVNFKKTETTDSKAAQRLLLQQALQQKIQRQQANLASSSSNANSTLTALLKSGPLTAPSLDLDLNDLSKSTFPDPVLQQDGIPEADEPAPDDFPGVIPIFVCQTDTSKTSSLAPPLANRSSSLPSFSALRASKPPPKRSNTDPQFQITRPPPNYNEATRQLKVKQPYLDGDDGNPRHCKKLKPSVKSQAVDDVLEILINNGELSPSAAQEPTTPISSSTTPFPSTTNAFPVDTTPSESHLSSLQSVLDLTPPSSTGFSAPSLDFDFPLEMPDIEAMELDGLQTSGTDLLSMVGQDRNSKLEMVASSKSAQLANHLMKTVELAEIHDRMAERGMDDNDLIEWLEVFEETSGQTNTFQNPSYGISNDSDPLLLHGHEALDFFSSDDMDFKPAFLPWGDNAT